MKLLILSTDQDLSLTNLEAAARNQNWQVKSLKYNMNLSDLQAAVAQHRFDWIYLRDPFNGLDYNIDHLLKATSLIVSLHPQARFVDNASSIDDLLFEDKWLQYQALSQFMPETKLLQSPNELIAGVSIAKQRISSRARGIAFSSAEIEPGADYILQPLLSIAREYRVYGVGQTVQSSVSIRSSKTATSKVKVQAIETISTQLLEYTQSIYAAVSHMDLVGFDIVELENGELKLIEVNRSCQFSRYEEKSSIDLASQLIAHLKTAST